MHCLRLSGVAAALGFFFAGGGCGAPLNEQLVGTYVNGTTCEAVPTATMSLYVTGQVTFSPVNYDLKVAYFSDSTCAAGNVTLSYEQQGAYRIGQTSPVIDTATEIDYDADLRLLTPQNASTATYLDGMTPCGATTKSGWTAGVPRDITQTGCQYLVASCPTEYDLIKLDGTSLTFGKRGSVGASCTTTGRPTTLGTTVFQKQVM